MKLLVHTVYRTVLYCTKPYCTAPYRTVLYLTVPYFGSLDLDYGSTE